MRLRNRRMSEANVEETGIDLAPMLDFVLNLLIFFIITTSFVKESGVTVTRPEALTAESKENGNILIAVRPNGDVWMDKQKVDVRDVRSAIERLHIERPEDTVVIIADRESKTGVLTKVMDQVKLGGVAEVSIAAAPPPG
jgi:biopolymer transport protein ExbD